MSQQDSDAIIELTADPGGTRAAVRTADGTVIRLPDGDSQPVLADDVADVLRDHGAALVPEDAVVTEVRSPEMLGTALIELLARAYGSERLADYLKVNGHVYVMTELDDGEPVWLPEYADGAPDTQVIIRAHWDLLSGEPSPGTGNPGTTEIVRVGDVWSVTDYSAEIHHARRGGDDPGDALGDLLGDLINRQTTWIESEWLAQDHAHVSQLLEALSNPWHARALFVNGRLWRRTGEGWTDAPRRGWPPDAGLRAFLDGLEFEELRLQTPTSEGAATPGPREVTGERGSDSAAHSLVLRASAEKPPQSTDEPHIVENYLLLPEPGPDSEELHQIVEAALKSTVTCPPLWICRVRLPRGGDRLGVSFEAQGEQLCEAFALDGWLEVAHHDGMARLATVSPDGKVLARAWGVMEKAPPFEHPLDLDEF